MDIKFSKLFSEQSNNKKTANFFDILDEKLKELQAQGVKIIDFGVGDPAKTIGVDDELLNEYGQVAFNNKYSGYPGNKGKDSYIQAVINYLQAEHQIQVNENEVNITGGSKTAVSIFPRILLDVGDIGICPCPGYPNFASGVLLNHGVPYFVPLSEENNFLIDFEAIPQDIANKAKLMWINYPNSPTGKNAPLEYLEKLIAWCHKNNIVLLSDEAYIDIYFDNKPVSPLHITKKGIVSFYSLSKSSNMTSSRVGFIAGDEKLIAQFYKLSNMHDDGVSHIIQDVATKALSQSTHFSNMRKDYQEKRDLIVNALVQKYGCSVPHHSEGSIFLWVKTPNNISGEEFASTLLCLGIAVIPGSSFTAIGNFQNDPASNYIRLALIPKKELVEEAVKRILLGTI